jgi:ABC-type microcin C transport system permease subunit YejE
VGILTDPFVQNAFMQRALVAGILVAIATGVVGTLMVLRGMAFLGDALAHGVLPGIAAALLIGIPSFIGALVGAGVMIGGVAAVQRRTRLSSDVAIGLLFVGMLALGVVIVLAALFQPSFWMLLGILALFQWIAITFFMRTEMYREKTREYCLAARSYGASHLRIVFRHLLPNCLTPLVTFTPFAVVGAIFALTGLDYLGYGLPAPTPSWGELIDQALQVENRSKLWLTLAPFTALTVTLVLVVFIGESVREAFDPKRYARYE